MLLYLISHKVPQRFHKASQYQKIKSSQYQKFKSSQYQKIISSKNQNIISPQYQNIINSKYQNIRISEYPKIPSSLFLYYLKKLHQAAPVIYLPTCFLLKPQGGGFIRECGQIHSHRAGHVFAMQHITGHGIG